MMYQGTLQLPANLTVRRTSEADRDFLLDMFMAARPWLATSPDDREMVHFLYRDHLRRRGIEQSRTSPDYLDCVVERMGQAIGHLVVHLGSAQWQVVSLDMHPLVRGRGYDADLLRGLQTSALRADATLAAWPYPAL